MPITWKNIEAPSLMGVAGMAESARRTFNDAVSALRSGFDEYGQQIQTQWDQGKEANTQAFLDQLAQYKTPEELAAAQAAGALQNLKAQFGNKIDRNAVRDAETTAAEQLMKRITTQNLYQDDTRRRGERDQMDVGRNYLLAKDYAGFDKWAAEYNLLDEPQLHELKRTYQRQDGQDSRAERQLGISLNRANQENIRFKQEQDAFKQKQFLGQQLAQSVQEIQQYDLATGQAMTAAAKKLGIPLDDDGLPVFSDDPIGQSSQRLFLSELEKQGIDPMGRTQSVNGMLNRYMAAPEMQNASIDQILYGRDALMKGITAINQLDPVSQSQLDAAKSAEAEQLKIVINARKEAQQAEAAKNPFYNPTKDVEKSTANIMSKLPKDFDPVGWDSHQKQLLESKIREYLSEGMSEDFVLNAVNTVAEMGTLTADTDDNFNDYMDEYFPVTKLAEQKLAADGMRSKHAQELRQLEAEAIAEQKRFERALRKAQGLPAESPAESLRRLSSLLKTK